MKNIKIYLYSYFKKYNSWLLFGGFLALIQSLFLIPMPLVTRRILDTTIVNKNLAELLILSIIIVFVLFLNKAVVYYKGLIFDRINNKVIFDLRIDLLKKLNKVKINKFKLFGIGYLISRINDDTERLSSLFADAFIGLLTDILILLVGLVAIFYLHPKLALVTIVLWPFYIYATLFYGKVIRNKSKIFYENHSLYVKQLEEALSMVETVKLFSRYNFNVLRYYKSYKTAFLSYLNLSKITFMKNFTLGIIGGLSPVIIILYGAYEIINGNLTIGTLIAFNSFAGYIFGPTNRLTNINISIQKGIVALERIIELFNLQEEKIENIVINNINIISFENISFKYDNELVLNKFNLSISKGEKIGIVGNSGCGKTTLIKILSGFYEIDDGKIIINNKEFQNSQIVALRKHIAVVEQEPFLFNDTILNNIKLGNSSATVNEILEISKKAHVDEFVRTLPDKYNTLVGIKGDNLSIGQKQRITIARALIRNPKILILDEATSSIDNFSEKYITETINNLPKDMIVIIVAHRLSTIKDCDKILVMDKGCIKEKGSHDELMSKKGLYFKLNNVMDKS